jgi:hypothetical protein
MTISATNEQPAEHSAPESCGLLSDVHVGDRIKISVYRPNVLFDVGEYETAIVAEDAHSFKIAAGDNWWFYRDNGHSYVGAAVVIEVIR